MVTIKGVAHVRVFVHPDKWDASLSFYGKTLGLKCVDRESGIFRLPDGVTIGVERVAPADPEGKDLVGRLVAVSFAVANVKGTHRQLEAKGVQFHGPPEKQPWGGALAFFHDACGNTLTLVEYPKSKR